MAIERADQISDPGRSAAATLAEPLLDEVVGRLVEALGPEQVYLFGSRARGDNQPDSDYDFMVIVPQSDLPPHRRAQLAHRALHGVRIAKDILVWTRAEFDRYVPVTASLPATVVREGQLLYDARSPG
jgi:predicted nucleotidyltransferase